MEGSKFEHLGFGGSGGSSYSNWKVHPMRFNNLVASIAKNQELKDSLKTLNIYGCEIYKREITGSSEQIYLKSVRLTEV